MRARLPLLLALTFAAVLAACGPTPPGPTTTTSSTSSTTTTSAPNTEPTASIGASTTSGVAHLSVDFDASGSTDADGTITEWEWDFGDGNTATTESAQNLYVVAGSYDVTLTVTDDEGATSTDAVTIEVLDDAEGRYVATTGSDAGNTCSLSATPCATVQHAVNQADATGDTVYVGSGSYPEMVYVAKNVDFKGANQGNPAGAEPVARRAESTVKGIRSGTTSQRPGTVQRDISIDGMAIDPQGDTALMTPSNQALVWLVGGPDTVVENSVFNGGTYTPNCSSTCTTMVDNALEIRSGHLRIEDNAFTNFRRAANIYQVGFAGVTINSASFVRNSISGHTSRGLQIAPSGQNKSLVGVTVEDNVFDATGYAAPSAPGSIVVTTGTNTYTGNRFVGAASAIYLYICTGSEYVTGPQTVVGNDFEGNGSAVNVFVEAPTPCNVGHLDGTTINQNNFISGNSGISMGSAAAYFGGGKAPIDLTCNWWGVPSGPNSGGRNATVHPSIVTSPWLDAPAPGGACTGT